MKQRLCCLINPYVMCALCRTGGCEECANKERYNQLSCNNKQCEGMWFGIEHEAITDPEVSLKHYLPGGKYHPPF
jgi:hypothetical protein